MGDDHYPRELLMWYPKRDLLARITWNKIMIFSEGWMASLYCMKEKPFYHCKWMKTFPNTRPDCTFTEMMRKVFMDCPYIDIYSPICEDDIRVRNIMLEI